MFCSTFSCLFVFFPCFVQKLTHVKLSLWGWGLRGSVTFTLCGSLLQGHEPRVTPAVGDCGWNLHHATTCSEVPKPPIELTVTGKRAVGKRQGNGDDHAGLSQPLHKNHQFLQFLHPRLRFSKCSGPALRIRHRTTETQNGLGWKGLENSSHFNPFNIFHQPGLFQALPSLALSSSRDGEATAPPDSLCQCLLHSL